ncbi:MAG TPA: hypothetical protein VF498_06280 [Anaerolineales bacterium]
MVRWLGSRALWGVLLVVVGVLFLIESLGFISFDQFLWPIFWAVVFGVAGLLFLSAFFRDRAQWWAIIPGLTLLGLSGITLLNTLAPSYPWLGSLSGGFFLGMIGVAFLVVYLMDRQKWWAIIPAGVLATLAVVAGLAELLPGAATGGVFFVGLALTFALLALLPNPQGSMQWAWIPAGVLFVMGLFIMSIAGAYLGYLWGLGLIVAGGFFLLRSFRRRAG